jgi:hypothetical protein
MLYRYAVAILGIVLVGAAIPAHSATDSSPVRLPLAGVNYRYWPLQFTQWIGPELPYEMIALSVDNRSQQPVYDAELVQKNGQGSIHYTNSAAQLESDLRDGLKAYRVNIQFDGPATPAMGSQYLLRFNTETGAPVVWQFVLGTDVSDRGSGLSSGSTTSQSLSFREEGALAGEGTALKIGGVTSVAEVWKEYAQIPYFVPYHGAVSSSVHVLTFTPGATQWKETGNALTNQDGATLSLAQGDSNFTLTDDLFHTTSLYSLAGAQGITRVSFTPAGENRHSLNLVFTSVLAPGGQGGFEIVAGKKNKLAAGTVQSASAANDGSVSEIWTFNSPGALHGKQVKATATLRTQP